MDEAGIAGAIHILAPKEREGRKNNRWCKVRGTVYSTPTLHATGMARCKRRTLLAADQSLPFPNPPRPFGLSMKSPGDRQDGHTETYYVCTCVLAWVDYWQRLVVELTVGCPGVCVDVRSARARLLTLLLLPSTHVEISARLVPTSW